jgi:hypothetical protein
VSSYCRVKWGATYDAAMGLGINLREWFEDNADEVNTHLRRYFGGQPGDLFTGRHFETFEAKGDPDRFEFCDVLAVEALSVAVPTEAAFAVFFTQAERLNGLLAGIPKNTPIWSEAAAEVIEDPKSDAWKLHAALDDIPDIGPVTAGKLMAAKRPMLIPILDKFVKEVFVPPVDGFWTGMREQLLDEETRRVIGDICAAAPANVTLLRRIDVAVWMHVHERGKKHD